MVLFFLFLSGLVVSDQQEEETMESMEQYVPCRRSRLGRSLFLPSSVWANGTEDNAFSYVLHSPRISTQLSWRRLLEFPRRLVVVGLAVVGSWFLLICSNNPSSDLHRYRSRSTAAFCFLFPA